jgi:hypothetical protein
LPTAGYRANVRRILALAVATVLLTACEAPPVYHPSPTPSVKPFFANEGEALAAFEDYMDQYVAALSTMVASDGGDRDDLAGLVSPKQLEDELEVLDVLARRSMTFVGAYRYFGAEIQQFNQDSAESAYVQAYVCLDYRESHYVLADGTYFEGETDWAPFEAILTAGQDQRMVMDELRSWTGRDFCENFS